MITTSPKIYMYASAASQDILIIPFSFRPHLFLIFRQQHRNPSSSNFFETKIISGNGLRTSIEISSTVNRRSFTISFQTAWMLYLQDLALGVDHDLLTLFCPPLNSLAYSGGTTV